MLNKIAIIGGDLRIVTLAKMFAKENYEVYSVQNWIENDEFLNGQLEY